MKQRARAERRVTSPNQRQFGLLFRAAMLDRGEQFHIGTCQPGKLVRIGGIVLPVAGGDPLQFARVSDDHFLAKPLQFAADPG